MLVKKRTSKKDFEIISKILMKIKRQYLVQKAKLFPQMPLDKITITDDDQVPLELADLVISQQRHKVENKLSLLQDLMDFIKNEQIKQVRVYNID